MKKSSLSLSIIMVVLLFVSCNNSSNTNKSGQLVVGIQQSPSNSLVIIASEKGLFDTSKVKVVLKNFSAGKLALQALLGNANDIDLAVCAETPVVLSSMGGNKFKVISQIVDAHNECRVVVKKDGSLNTPQKYFSKKRKLATSQGGSPEWTTFNFIKTNNLNQDNIEIIAMQPEDQPVALVKGAVDAICIFDPFARIGEKQLGNDGQTFLNSNLTSYYVLCVKEQTLNENKNNLKAFLEGLMKAQEFIKKNPEESKTIIANYTKLDKDIISDTWGNYNFSIGLSQAFIDLCIQESQWTISSKKYPEGTAIPSYKDVAISTLLKEVNASSTDIK